MVKKKMKDFPNSLTNESLTNTIISISYNVSFYIRMLISCFIGELYKW